MSASVFGQMSRGRRRRLPRSLPSTCQVESDPAPRRYSPCPALRGPQRRPSSSSFQSSSNWPGRRSATRWRGRRSSPCHSLPAGSCFCRSAVGGWCPPSGALGSGVGASWSGACSQMLFAGVYAITALDGEPLEASFVFFLLGFLALFVGGLAWGTSLLRSGASMAGGGLLATAVAGLLAMLLGMDPWHDVFLLSSYAAWTLVGRGFDAIPSSSGAPRRSRRQRRLTSSQPVAEEFRSVPHSGQQREHQRPATPPVESARLIDRRDTP